MEQSMATRKQKVRRVKRRKAPRHTKPISVIPTDKMPMSDSLMCGKCGFAARYYKGVWRCPKCGGGCGTA